MTRFGMMLALVALVGCFDIDRVNGPVLGYESDPDACEDGMDNDRDGRIDCRDSSCLGSGVCGVIVVEGLPAEPENTFEKCIDRIDNDQDGNWDCGDRNCQAIQELCCVTEFSDAACRDGFDNDDNGFRDCDDFGCRSNDFVSVCDAEVDCDNGRDDDSDDAVDCDDTDCQGVDGCPPAPPLPDPEPEDTLAKCMDEIDNDQNGFTDCADFDCSRSPNSDIVDFCNSRAENTLERCQDGVDNDGNGFTDCRDFSCSRSTVPAIMELCAVDEEDGFFECKDGIDNDEDGFPDCADFSCRGVIQMGVEIRNAAGEPVLVTANPCRESITIANPFTDRVMAIREAIERCTNRLDEDQDGFTDCDDWDCQWNPLMRPTVDEYIAAGRSPEAAAASEDGFCQGWRFNRTTGWAFDPAAPTTPLLCR